MLRKGYDEVTDVRQTPGAKHPLVRTDPRTGRKALFLGRRPRSYICGLPVDESEALLVRLLNHTTQPDFVYAHKWTVGDIVIWDNRAVLHRGRSWNDAIHKRTLHRTTVAGDGPTV